MGNTERRIASMLLLGLSGAVAATECPGPVPPPPPTGVCSVVAGTGPGLLLVGDVLLPDDVLHDGQVLIGADGQIACAACDCSATPGFATAPRALCPQGAISPGLIDLFAAQGFAQNRPYNGTFERYEHRSDWRLGVRGHTQVNAPGGAITAQQNVGALRHLFGGTTAIGSGQPGSSASNALLRMLDRAAPAAELGIPVLDHENFPWGTAADFRTGDCLYAESPAPTAGQTWMPTLGEGVDTSARNEWTCTVGQGGTGGVDLVGAVPVRGLVGPLAADVETLRSRGATWVAAPRSNSALYGTPGALGLIARTDVPIALASVWTVTGSINVRRELACMDELNTRNYGATFDDAALWRMATVNPARAIGAASRIGVIAPGRIADLVVFDARVRADHRAVILGDERDVVLVLRGGVPMFGDAPVLAALGSGDGQCEVISLCATGDKRVCTLRDLGQTYASILSSVGPNTYPPAFCGVPDNEPTCVPARIEPSDPSGPYTGLPAPGDADGDGIADAQDNCPAVFNPRRPIDGMAQADADTDGIGDECDACAIETGNLPCVRAIFGDGFESP
jgi:cytosine/adenosine deaminase-related metal-dependent hydrolase